MTSDALIPERVERCRKALAAYSDDDRFVCLIDLLAWGQGLDESLPERGRRWTPHRRMLALLTHVTDVRARSIESGVVDLLFERRAVV